MTESSRVPRVTEAEISESSGVPREPRAEMTESSRLPRVPKAHMTESLRVPCSTMYHALNFSSQLILIDAFKYYITFTSAG